MSLIREFRERADFEAGRLVAAAEDGGDKDHARRVAAAVVALLQAAENHERQPALYMRFEWPSLITPEELDEAWYRHEGRTDFGFESIRDLLTRGPLIVLKSKSIDGAQTEAAEYWEDRSALEPAEKPAQGYCVFDQTGLILFGYPPPRDP